MISGCCENSSLIWIVSKHKRRNIVLVSQKKRASSHWPAFLCSFFAKINIIPNKKNINGPNFPAVILFIMVMVI